MTMLKTMGWSIRVSQITGKVTVYRQGQAGCIEIPQVDGALCARIVDEDDKVADTVVVQHKYLERGV